MVQPDKQLRHRWILLQVETDSMWEERGTWPTPLAQARKCHPSLGPPPCFPDSPALSPQHLGEGVPHREDRAEQEAPLPRTERERIQLQGKGSQAGPKGDIQRGWNHTEKTANPTNRSSPARQGRHLNLPIPPPSMWNGGKYEAVSRPGNRGIFYIQLDY